MSDSAHNGNLYRLLQGRFPADRRAIAIDHHRYPMSFADLDRETGRLVAMLRAGGVAPGDRVLVQVPKSPEALLLYLACLRAGFIFTPLNPALTPEETAFFIADAEPRLIVWDADRAQAYGGGIATGGDTSGLLTLNGDGSGTLMTAARNFSPDAAIASVGAADIAAILYTSGTTGRAKGAMISHGNLIANVTALHEVWKFAPGDVLLHALPLHHVHGLFVAVHCALFNGSRMRFLDRFDAGQVINALPDITVMMGVPTFYGRLLGSARLTRRQCAGVRLFISGSAPLSPEVFRRFRARTGHRILERYGMTEAGMITSNPCDGARVPGTVGYALPGVRVRVADADGREQAPGNPGLLEITGPNVFPGYWRMPERGQEDFRPDGFFITGDIAVMDDTGRVTIAGREVDMIISGGENIYPGEIETLIDTIPGVVESAVIGAPHPDFGEGVVAVIVTDTPDTPDTPDGVDADRVRAHLAGRIARFKLPGRVFTVPALPRNAMGKVQKSLLRSRFAGCFAP